MELFHTVFFWFQVVLIGWGYLFGVGFLVVGFVVGLANRRAEPLPYIEVIFLCGGTFSLLLTTILHRLLIS